MERSERWGTTTGPGGAPPGSSTAVPCRRARSPGSSPRRRTTAASGCAGAARRSSAGTSGRCSTGVGSKVAAPACSSSGRRARRTNRSRTARSRAAPVGGCRTFSCTSASPTATCSSTPSCTRSSGSTTPGCARSPRIRARRSSSIATPCSTRSPPTIRCISSSPSAPPPRRASPPGSARTAARPTRRTSNSRMPTSAHPGCAPSACFIPAAPARVGASRRSSPASSRPWISSAVGPPPTPVGCRPTRTAPACRRRPSSTAPHPCRSATCRSGRRGCWVPDRRRVTGVTDRPPSSSSRPTGPTTTPVSR